MNNTSRNKSIIDYIDYIALLLYSAVLLLDFSKYVFSNSISFQPLFVTIRVLVLIVGLFKIIYYFKSNPLFSISAVMLIISLFAFQYYKMYALYGRYPKPESFLFEISLVLLIVIVAISLYGICFDRINIVFFISIGTSYTIRVLGAICGLLPNGIAFRDSRGRPAYDFGFVQYNTAMIYYLFIAISWIYLVRNLRSRLYHYISIMIIGTVLYYFTTSRTSFAVLIFACIFLILYTISPSKAYESIKQKLLIPIRFLMMLTPIFSCIITFVLTLIHNYAHENSVKLIGSRTFWMRFKSTSEDFTMNGIHLPYEYYKLDKYKDVTYNWLLGGDIKSKYCDNLWHLLFIVNGTIIFIVLLVALQLLAVKAYKNKHTILLLIIGLFSIFSLMESTICDIGKNSFLMLVYTSSSILPLSIFATNRDNSYSNFSEGTNVNAISYNPLNAFSFKKTFKRFVSSLSNHATAVIVLLVVYLVVTMVTTASIIYQVITYTVSAWFNVWMVCTAYLIILIWFLTENSNQTRDNISLKRLLRRYGVQLALSLIIALIGCISVMSYALTVSTYEINTNDPQLIDGVALNRYSYDQTFYCSKPGLATISIYVEDYGPDYNPIPLSMFDTEETCGLSVTLTDKDYTPGKPFIVDVQSNSYGSFKKDMVYQIHFFNTTSYGAKVPVLKKVVYTCYEEFPILACICRLLPFLLIIDLIWIVSSIITIIRHRS